MKNRKSIPVDEKTRDRLRAFARRDLFNELSYIEAINQLLDGFGFPQLDNGRPDTPNEYDGPTWAEYERARNEGFTTYTESSIGSDRSDDPDSPPGGIH